MCHLIWGGVEMARTLAELPKGSRITDYVSLGVLAKTFPSEKVKSVLASTGKESIRQRDLPAHVVVYYVIALACTCSPRIGRCCGACWRGFNGC